MLDELMARPPIDAPPRSGGGWPCVPAAEPRVRLFQIAYDETTSSQVDDDFEILDNLENARPDWFEYWPIRNYLMNQALDEETLYGFFSPKFRHKTGLGCTEVLEFVQQRAAVADVFLFSPQPDMGAFFLNVFEQAEAFDPGLIETANRAFQAIGLPLDVACLVMDSRQIVFSNYFVARPRFWREWLRINEAIFAICEGSPSALKDSLCQPTNYPGAAQRKVFIQERVASLMLTAEPSWRSAAYNPFGMAWSASRFREYPIYAYVNDALKFAFRANAYPQYIEAFTKVRQSFQSNAQVQTNALPSAFLHRPASPAVERGDRTLLSHFRSRIPIIVPTFNNPSYTRNMIDQLKERGMSEIIIVDNHSESVDMIDLLAELDESHNVIRLDENRGPHHVFLDNQVFEALPQIFCLTDPDIKFNSEMPANVLETLLDLTEKFSIGKAGLALDLSNQDAMQTEKAVHGGQEFHIWEWETQFWVNRIDTLRDTSPVYLADIDTTFALYNKKFFSRNRFYHAVRVAGKYSSFHLPWYKDNGMKPKEDSQYRATQKYSYYVK